MSAVRDGRHFPLIPLARRNRQSHGNPGGDVQVPRESSPNRRLVMGMREYETIFILKSDGVDDALDRLSGKFDKVFYDYKAVLLEKENWGKKKMAYDIAKNSKGMYIYYHYLGGGALVAEVERNLKID